MAFTNSFRMERVYFERLKSMIDILKPYLNSETDEKLKSILENSIDDNGAILLLYRNLGECWAELSDLIKKADEKIDSLDDKTEKYHDELNERIDEVNNYIMGILREIEARLEAVEQDLATLSRNIILDLERVNDEYSLSYKGDSVDFAQLAEWVSFPDNVIVRGVVNGEETVFHLRKFDTNSASGVFEFFATGLIDNVVHEITVTVLPDDSVNVATDIQQMKEYSAGNGINIDSNDEISVDTDVIQEKLTAGSGISIDPDTKEITNTAQGKIYTAGDGIDISENDVIINTGLIGVYNKGDELNSANCTLIKNITPSVPSGAYSYEYRKEVMVYNLPNNKKKKSLYFSVSGQGIQYYTGSDTFSLRGLFKLHHYYSVALQDENQNTIITLYLSWRRRSLICLDNSVPTNGRNLSDEYGNYSTLAVPETQLFRTLFAKYTKKYSLSRIIVTQIVDFVFSGDTNNIASADLVTYLNHDFGILCKFYGDTSLSVNISDGIEV